MYIRRHVLCSFRDREMGCAVKVGDLIKPGQHHGLRNEAYRIAGIVIERYEANYGCNAYVTVVWNDGDIETEWPEHLEILSESR